LVAEVENVLERFASNFDVTLSLDHERTLINGRADAVYNRNGRADAVYSRVVIEYEPPGPYARATAMAITTIPSAR
jgi:hypothetical protein